MIDRIHELFISTTFMTVRVSLLWGGPTQLASPVVAAYIHDYTTLYAFRKLRTRIITIDADARTAS